MTTPDRDQPRDGNGRWTRGADSIERDAEALRMRSRNATLRQIDEALGYGSPSNVRRALAAATERIEAPAVAQLRLEQDAQLDELAAAAQRVLDAKHVTISNGRVVTLPGPDGGDPKPVEDDAPVLRAVETLLRIAERRAKLWGLDAPVKADVNTNATVRYEIPGVDLGRLS